MVSSILILFFFVSCIAFWNWHKYSKEQQLRELISWSAIGDYSPVMGCYSYVREPVLAVFNAQYDKSIDPKYRMSFEEDQKCVTEIIEAFQQDIMRSYFRGQRIVIKSKYAVREETYFIFALYVFLCEHQSEYFETDKKIVYRKLNYITYMYCKNNKALQNYVPSWNERCLKESIDEVLAERS